MSGMQQDISLATVASTIAVGHSLGFDCHHLLIMCRSPLCTLSMMFNLCLEVELIRECDDVLAWFRACIGSLPGNSQLFCALLQSVMLFLSREYDSDAVFVSPCHRKMFHCYCTIGDPLSSMSALQNGYYCWVIHNKFLLCAIISILLYLYVMPMLSRVVLCHSSIPILHYSASINHEYFIHDWSCAWL
jgi:hypothetical protein